MIAYMSLFAERGIEFWTGDQRLFNALHTPLPFIRRVGHYQRKRP
jgi:hypothetical protein